jgi:hypothetical protein
VSHPVNPAHQQAYALASAAVRGAQDRMERLRLAQQIACIGDTDGDGNCPLAACPHCRPQYFTVAQLREIRGNQMTQLTTSPEELAEALFIAAVTPPIADVGLNEKLARDVWRLLSPEAQSDRMRLAERVIALLSEPVPDA